jgi:hypothetical protein
MPGQLSGGGRIQQPDEAASFRSDESGRQQPVDFLLGFQNGFHDFGLCRTSDEEQYHSRLIDHR